MPPAYVPPARPFPPPTGIVPQVRVPIERPWPANHMSLSAGGTQSIRPPIDRGTARLNSRTTDLAAPRSQQTTFRDYIAKNYADWIGDEQRLMSAMRWLPIAKRPALAVRWGVGVTMGQMTARKAIWQAAELSRLTGPSGPGLVQVLAERLDEKRDGPWCDLADVRLAKVPVFSAESEDQLIDEAARQNLDGLVLMSVSAQRVGVSKKIRATMLVRLVDVLAHRATWTSAPLSSQKAQATQGTAEDASVALVRSVLTRLDEDYRLAPLPPLSANVVQQRASHLAKVTVKPGAMLRTLAELRYYQASKLLNHDEAQRCYQSLLGDKAAEALAGPDAAARTDAIQEWFQSHCERETDAPRLLP